MKRIILALLLCVGFAAPAYSQGAPPFRLQEIDGSPSVLSPTVIKITNGALSCTGKTCTITVTGGSGSPGGSSGQVQYNDGAGGFGGSSGITLTATIATLTNARVVTAINDTNGNQLFIVTATGSAVNEVTFANAATGSNPRFTASGDDADVGFDFLVKGAGVYSLLASASGPTDLRLFEDADNGSNYVSIIAPASLGANRVATLQDAAGTIPVIAGSLAVASGKTATVSNTLTFTGTDSSSVAFGAGGTVAYIGTANAWADGVKQTFNPDGTNAGVNVGSHAGDPGSPANGDLWYDSTANELTARINGANVALGAGGGGITVGTTTITSGTDTRVLFNNAGVVGEYAITGTTNVVMSASPTLTGTVAMAAATASGTITQTSASATAFASGLNGATNPTFLIVNNVASQASGVSVTGRADGTAPTIASLSRTQAASSIAGNGLAITADPAIAGASNAGAAAGGAITLTGGAAARLTSGNADGGNIVITPGAGIGSGVQGQLLISNDGSTTKAAIAFGGAAGVGFYKTGSAIVATCNNSDCLGISAGNSRIYGNSGAIILGSSGGSPSLANMTDAGIRVTNGSTGAGNLAIGTSAAAFGTSGAGVLAFTLSTAPSTSPVDTVQTYSGDSAAGDHNLFSRNEAGEVNRLTGLSARNSSAFAKTSDTTLANITGLTRNVEASRAYAFRAVLETTAAATGGVKFAVSGTATATSINYEGLLYNGAAVVAQTRSTALDGVVCAVTNATAATCVIEGVIVVNAAGTLTVQFAQNASDGGASTVLINQYLQLIPIS